MAGLHSVWESVILVWAGTSGSSGWFSACGEGAVTSAWAGEDAARGSKVLPGGVGMGVGSTVLWAAVVCGLDRAVRKKSGCNRGVDQSLDWGVVVCKAAALYLSR